MLTLSESLFSDSLITDYEVLAIVTNHDSRQKGGEAPGSSGGCKPGAGGLKQKRGRSKFNIESNSRCRAYD